MNISVLTLLSLTMKSKICQPIRGKGGHIGFQIQLISNNTCSWPHMEHLCKDWSRSLQPYMRSFWNCVSQSETREAILDFRSA